MFGKDRERIEQLEKELQKAQAENLVLSQRVAKLEEAYAPIFDFFLGEKKANDPKNPSFFAPQHDFGARR